VWAPHARSVHLLLGDERVPLAKGVGDWWYADRPLEPGTDYLFSVDDGTPRPDPRSPFQPSGPHGPSRTVDHSAFDWTDTNWCAPELRDAVIYECHIGTFTQRGTFEAAIETLPHLVDLGVTALELMPVAEFPGSRGWGYDGVDLFAPHHAYGGPDGLKRLVDAAHGHGLAMILDCVYNHLGPDGNHLAEFGPYFTDRYSTPWGQAVNLDDAYSTQVRSFFIENVLMWMRDYHFDGVRLDAVHAIYDMSALHFLEELKASVASLEIELDRRLWVIAESDLNDPRLVADRSTGGYGLDAQWSDDFHHALHAILTGDRSGYYADFWSVAQLAKALQHAFVYDGVYSRYRKRVHGRRPEGIPGYRFLGYMQNHDQVGNRATGERSSALMDPELLKVAAALVLTAPFVPMLFMGEEWGASTPFQYFTDHNDELGRLVSEGRKREFASFGWEEAAIPDPQDPATFERSRLDWGEPEDPKHADLLAWHRSLIRLRREHPDLTDGRLDAVRVDHDETARWLSLRRGGITVICNLSLDKIEVPLNADGLGRLRLTSSDPVVGPAGITLAPTSVSVFECLSKSS